MQEFIGPNHAVLPGPYCLIDLSSGFGQLVSITDEREGGSVSNMVDFWVELMRGLTPSGH